jgi:2-oxoisovalerate dehydrogenase E2 component (dihydrolipoyl transacylase)
MSRAVRASVCVVQRCLLLRAVRSLQPTYRAQLHQRRRLHASPRALKIISFNLPDIGEGIAEVEVLKWFVKPGDKISQFDRLLEVQSDKATVDITSRYDGVVAKLHHKVGEMAPTGKPLLDIELFPESPGETRAAAPSATASPPSSPAPESSAANDDDPHSLRALATPAVRRIAREHGLTSLTQVTGTGKDGRVTKEDVQRFVAAGGAAAAASNSSAQFSSGAAAGTAASSPPVAAPVSSGSTPAPPPPRPAAAAAPSPRADVVVPVRGLQRAMVKSMTSAWAAPHFGFADEVVMDELMRVRAALIPTAQARGLKLSYLPLMMKAASLALSQFPQVSPAATG